MAFVSKKAPKGGLAKRVLSSQSSAPVSLPAEVEEPPVDVTAYTYLIFGERKIGKTSFASQFPNPFILGFEPVGKSVRARKVLVHSWDDYLQYISLIAKNPKYCDTIIVDNGSYCYDRCFESVMQKLGIEKPKDLESWDSPMAWKQVEKEFFEAHQALFALGKGLVFTAHSEVKEFTRRDQTKFHKLTLQLSKQAMRYFASVVDVIGYFQYGKGDERVLTIRGDETIEAGCRLGEQFLYSDGTPIKDIPMGHSPKEAYANFVRAFNNQLKNPESQEKEVPAERKKLKRS